MGLFLIAGLVAIALETAPVGIGPTALPSPDLLFCVVAHWALRAPGAVPVLLVFALGLARDLLSDPPLGLAALALVFAAEWLKSRRGLLARQPFFVEWLTVAVAAAAMMSAIWLAVVLSLAQPPYLSHMAQQFAFTVLAFPLIGGVLSLGLGVREGRGRQRSATRGGAASGGSA
ncbi:MAG: rod shape-determining protein MreD [Pikeienuella sp.]